MINSVVALKKLSADLFLKHHAPGDMQRTCFSLAGSNLLFSWFAMLSVCSSFLMVFLDVFKCGIIHSVDDMLKAELVRGVDFIRHRRVQCVMAS